MTNRFLVAGAANIDVIAKTKTIGSQNNHRGDIDFALGGCGLNMAINLKNIGAETFFISALNNKSIMAQLINQQLQQKNIHNLIINNENIKDSAFSCIIDKEGETKTSILQEVLYSVDINQDIFNTALEKDISAMLITAELSPLSISNAIKSANQKNIPIFIAGCSAEEVTRINFNAGKIDYLFLNEHETLAFAKHNKIDNIEDLAQKLNTSIVMTMGKNGVKIINKDNTTCYKIDQKEFKGNTLGAGDYFMASFVYHLLNSLNIDTAIANTFNTIINILNKNQAN